MNFLISVGGWAGGVHKDTADTFTVSVIGDSDVTFFSPVSGPGVSDDPVVLATFASVTNSGDGVIEVSSTSLVVVDTTTVRLPIGTLGINGDAGWLSLNGSLQLSGAFLWDMSICGGLNKFLGALGFARSGSTRSRGVWVVSFEFLSVLLGILEGVHF